MPENPKDAMPTGQDVVAPVKFELPGGSFITIDPAKIPPPRPHYSHPHGEYIVTAGPVSCIYVGAIFRADKCVALVGPAANAATALLMGHRWVEDAMKRASTDSGLASSVPGELALDRGAL